MPVSLSDLYSHLNEDRWRFDANHEFRDDIATANDVLFNPFVRDTERREAMESWLQRYQPCLFGRLAAKRRGIHYCFLGTEDLLKPDDHIRQKIAASRRLWKQRALRGEPEHGFLLAACDRKVAWANPDETLRQFALHLQQLAGWVGRPESRGNDIVDEWLFLEHPKNADIIKFVFSVDFFASAADGRWWHDHRIPGGLAFTANSLGHMVRRQEWYENRDGRIEWALRTAMLTIDAADREVPNSPATFLLEERPGKPIRPYSWTEETKPSEKEKLGGKDCGSYGGYLHTDHAVRAEFFQPYEAPQYKEEPYLMDFAYIFDPASADHVPFVVGQPVTRKEVEAELGTASEMRILAAGDDGQQPRDADLPKSIEPALTRCRTWRLTDEEEPSML